MLGKKIVAPPDQLNTCPREVEHVWGWFMELHTQRGSNGFGENSLSFVDMEAWARLTGRSVRPWEVQLILALDRTFLLQKSEDGRRNKDSKS